MKPLLRFCFALALLAGAAPAQDPAFNGSWKLIPAQSSNLDYFREGKLDFKVTPEAVTVTTWRGPKRPFTETLTLKTDGKPQVTPITDGTFADDFFMAVRLPVGAARTVTAQWVQPNELQVTERSPAETSQGTVDLLTTRTYVLSPQHDLVTCRVTRNTRQTGPELVFVYKRADANNAWSMQLTDDWRIDSALPAQACLISIQGVVNQHAPQLYFTFGPKYPFNHTAETQQYLEASRHFTFTPLATLDDALAVFHDQVKGYVVWDKQVRTSLIVAYTLAGLENGIVITEDLIPLARKHGLREIDDFRGRFTGQSDFEIYAWAKAKYWSRCSREVITWIGGENGPVVMPACADYGMEKKTFFSDLSSHASDTQEYALTHSLLSEMKPLGQVWGWHSYKKDQEEEMTTLLSSYALVSDGLNTIPNSTFLLRIPATPGYKFRNHHNVVPGQTYPPGKKVYLALVQTDGLGIGSWTRPGRGSIPYAWEVPPKMLEMSPAMLEFYYDQATPNDYFIAALSGSSYMYPCAFPDAWRPKEIARARGLMEQLDLKVFEIMDYSHNKAEAGDNNLPKTVVDQYFAGMPDAIGFLNGYYAANTFARRGTRPFLSYDYYLPAGKPEADAAADLTELAAMNPARPYFLLVHVRENSDVARVKRITDRLGKDFEILPLDIFLTMAGQSPTFQERYQH